MTDKEAYEAAAAELDRVKAFVEKPRCINCDRWIGGKCDVYGEVPEEYWFTPSDCNRWMLKLPF